MKILLECTRGFGGFMLNSMALETLGGVREYFSLHSQLIILKFVNDIF